MIKKFFAKLTGWGQENKAWGTERLQANAEHAREEASHQREMAEERRQASLLNIPEEERIRRLKDDASKTVETRDKAA